MCWTPENDGSAAGSSNGKYDSQDRRLVCPIRDRAASSLARKWQRNSKPPPADNSRSRRDTRRAAGQLSDNNCRPSVQLPSYFLALHRFHKRRDELVDQASELARKWSANR